MMTIQTDLLHLRHQGGQGQRGSDPRGLRHRPPRRRSARARLAARRRRRSRRKTRMQRKNAVRSMRRRLALKIRARSGVVDDAIKVEDVVITVTRRGIAAGFHRHLLRPRVPRTTATATAAVTAMDPDRNLERLAQKCSV